MSQSCVLPRSPEYVEHRCVSWILWFNDPTLIEIISKRVTGLSFENITDKFYLVHSSGVFGTGFTARLTHALTC